MQNAYPGRVEIARRQDEDELMELCRQLHLENGIFPLNEDKVRKMLRNGFERNGAIVGTIGPSGAIEALICMMISSFWYSDSPHIEELFAYVSPPYRKSRNAVDMMGFAKWCSDQSGFPLVIGVISNTETKRKIDLYDRKFGKPVGNFYLYKPGGGGAE